MLVKVMIIFGVLAFVSSCDKADKLAAGLPTPPPETTTPVKRLPPLDLKTDVTLQQQIESIAIDAKGTVGVAVVALETGDAATLNADNQFAMQSVYKLPIAMAVLHLVDAEKLALDELIGVTKDDLVTPGQRSPIRDKHPDGTTLAIRELIRFAISESDGSGSDVLLRLAGGPAEVQSDLAAIGVNEVAVENSEKEFALDWQTQYRNWITPNATVALLRSLHEGNGISPKNRELLLKDMTDSPTGPNRLKGLLPQNTPVAHKTGTSGKRDNITAATNDIGIITLPDGQHLLVAVFVGDSAADEKTRESVIARIAKAAYDRFSP